MNDKDLCELAKSLRDRAWAPYSRFTVGAALLDEEGRVFTGCNVENVSYGLTLCAERNAVAAAVAAGSRRFVAIAVAGGREGEKCQITAPCGACRQVFAEWNHPDLRILLAKESGWEERSLRELLPEAFEIGKERG